MNQISKPVLNRQKMTMPQKTFLITLLYLLFLALPPELCRIYFEANTNFYQSKYFTTSFINLNSKRERQRGLFVPQKLEMRTNSWELAFWLSLLTEARGKNKLKANGLGVALKRRAVACCCSKFSWKTLRYLRGSPEDLECSHRCVWPRKLGQ